MEQQGKSITEGKKWQQLNYSHRQKIEILSKAGHNAKVIAELVGYSRRTVERELARGKVKVRHLRPDPYASFVPTKREYVESYEYSADIAQQACDYKATAKGIPIKLGKNRYFCETLVKYIKQGYSPYSALKLIEHNPQEKTRCNLSICVKTLYNYIHSDFIPGLTICDLPEQGKERKRDYNRVRLALNNLKGRSIEERSPEIAQRKTFGHWEIDCIEGKAGTKNVLLVMSERLTRQELIFKMSCKTQDEVKKVLDGLEELYGIEKFRRIFKTLTCDNGCEFLNQSKLENSIRDGLRTTVYYCHPYAAYERGTNENLNRMIRRHIPKGSDIGNYTPTQIRKIQDHINSTPRLVLEGYPSNTRFNELTA